VDYLRKFMEPGAATASKGKMLLATVKGDVHDIGKNLVDMILSNNGYEVINLGIKVPPETLIEAARKHNPDFIGLSGLLVRSAQQMVVTAEDLRDAGIDVPLLVGGAALTKNFTLTKIAPSYNGPVFYAGEAMHGLQIANRLMDEAERPVLLAELEQDLQRARAGSAEAPATAEAPPAPAGGWRETDVPDPPDLEEHVEHGIPLEEVLPLLNRIMLFGKYLGLKNTARALEDPADERAQELKAQVESVIAEAARMGILRPRALWRWLPAYGEGDSIVILDPRTRGVLVRWDFPRQKKEPFACAADWLRPLERGGDHLGLFVTTAGPDPAPVAARWKEEGRLLDSHILSSVAIELAEATAEWVHRRMRADWGFPDPPEFTQADLFKTRYRGIRLSFGYPACPRIENQTELFRILRPEGKIGVLLTEGCMMQPESSVSALVFHHPDGHYFSP